MQWIKLTERMPNPDEHGRVLIYTEGYDFNGEQVFDVKAETLNECSYADPDDQPEVCKVASHWMPHLANTGAPDWTAEQKAANALRLLMDSLPPGTQTSMTVFRPEVNGQRLTPPTSRLIQITAMRLTTARRKIGRCLTPLRWGHDLCLPTS